MKSIFVIIFAIACWIATLGSAADLSSEARKILYQNFEIQEYADGAFFISYKLPKTLIFQDAIKSGQYEEFRRAIVDHDVNKIVLRSPGGNVYEGLRIAGMIFDKKIDTYIPEGSKCFSACSFLFFAGKERHVDGELGVHQFYLNKEASEQKDKIGEIMNESQLTIADIIQYLNEFNTPPKIFEWMLRTDPSEMYVLNKYNLQEIGNDDISQNFENDISKINSFLNELQFAVADAMCESKPATCTKDQLCSKATTGVDQKSWKKSSKGKKFVDEAKKRGLQCDVPPPTCNESILACTDNEICADATSNSNGKIIWKTEESNLKFVEEAKKRKLQCDVSPPTCDEKISACTNNEICYRAIFTDLGKAKWNSSEEGLKFVEEAKRRGLTCKVEPVSCYDDPSICSDVLLCKLSTSIIDGKKGWEKNNRFIRFVEEAKRRNLTCFNEEKSVPKTDTVTQNLVKQIQRKLNELGCNAGPIDGIVGSKTKRAIKQAAEINNLQKYSLNFVGDRTYLEKYFLRKVKEFKKKCISSVTQKPYPPDFLAGTWKTVSTCPNGTKSYGELIISTKGDTSMDGERYIQDVTFSNGRGEVGTGRMSFDMNTGEFDGRLDYKVFKNGWLIGSYKSGGLTLLDGHTCDVTARR